MKTLEAVMATACEVYVPKGKEVAGLFAQLRGLGMEVPELSRKRPQVVVPVDASGGKFDRRFTSMRGEDAVGLLGAGFRGDPRFPGAVAFAGTDVCKELIASGTLPDLCYQQLPNEGPPMCTFELLFKAPDPDILRRLRGEGRPVTAVTSLPNLLTQRARQQNLNVVPAGYVPRGSVEVMVNLGVGEIGADLVTYGDACQAANLQRGRDIARAFVLDAIYCAAIWPKGENNA